MVQGEHKESRVQKEAEPGSRERAAGWHGGQDRGKESGRYAAILSSAQHQEVLDLSDVSGPHDGTMDRHTHGRHGDMDETGAV